MKKLAAVLSVLLLVFASVATAEDLQGMTTDELVALRKAINTELISRGFEKEVTVPAGTYIIGIDIPEGKYTISTDAFLISFAAYGMDGDFDAIHSIQPTSPIGKITLYAGQKVEIVGGSVIFSPYTGLGF